MEKKYVLILDDDTMTLNAVASYIQDLGAIPLTAQTKAEAIRLLKEYPHTSLAVIDMILSEEQEDDGMGVASELQKLFPSLKIALMSGYFMSQKEFPYLPKPIARRDLFHFLTEELFEDQKKISDGGTEDVKSQD